MAEEVQISECNGDEHPQITQISNIIDQMDTFMVCEKRECDPVPPSESDDGSGISLEDNNDSLEINTEVKVVLENTDEESQAEQDTAAEQDSGVLSSHDTHSKEHGNGKDCETTLEVESDNVPTHDSPAQEGIIEQEKEESNSEAQDIFMFERATCLSDTREEELLTETEEENTSIETDNDNGQGSCDEQENGPGPFLLGSPSGSNFEFNELVPGSRPDISRHSYSRYDTVSYRKIRRGNTKQRIDEFESMMN